MNEQRVAIVTGSSSGIGEATARRLTAEGFVVVVNSATSVAAGEALAADLVGASYVQADIANPQDAQRLIDTTVARYGRLDVLVNNAGTTVEIPHGELTSATADIWTNILSVNVIGTWQVTVAAISAMTHGGHVINISSVAGSRPVGSSIPYAVSKAALNHMTRLLANVVGPSIQVNAIAPGLIATPWTDTESFAEVASAIRGAAPLRRVGQPEEIAAAILGVLNSPYMTGEVLHVDGGVHLM